MSMPLKTARRASKECYYVTHVEEIRWIILVLRLELVCVSQCEAQVNDAFTVLDLSDKHTPN